MIETNKIIDFQQFIKKVLNEKNYCIVGIDGDCASGKTTLAEIISDNMNATVLHVDDFFLPLEQRKKNWRELSGGNIDFMRVSDVLENYLVNGERSYQRYDCQKKSYFPARLEGNQEVIVIEGSYSLLLEKKMNQFKPLFDLKIFMEIGSKQQLERIIKRNGEKALKQFQAIWIPQEKKYFSETRIKETVDYIITN